MDFARKILGKYGWKDGDGLGKNNNGIAKPLRATLKFDNAGFGADQAAADFNNHWWERVFNDAASNVEIKHDGETIKMDLVDIDDGVEISTKGYSLKKLKKAKKSRDSNKKQMSESSYNNFLQAATLTNTGGEIVNPDRIETSDIEVSKVKVLTDEELFKACGGRTAHKGARHGLKLSGKLARLQQQEEELLAKMLANRNCTTKEKEFNIKPQNKSKNMSCESNDCSNEPPSNENNETIKSKKKKRKYTKEDLTENVTTIQEFEVQSVKEKKKSRKMTVDIVHEAEYQNCETSEPTKEAKSKKKKKKYTDANIFETPANVSNVVITKSKKKKEKCVVDETAEETADGIKKKNKSNISQE